MFRDDDLELNLPASAGTCDSFARGGSRNKQACSSPVALRAMSQVGYVTRQDDESFGLTSLSEHFLKGHLESIPDGADAYVLKHVLHNWDDLTAREILRNVRSAMSVGSHLMTIEGMVDHDHTTGDTLRAWWDIAQVVGTCGRSQTPGQFASLLRDAGFEVPVVTTTGLPDCSILDATPLPTSQRVIAPAS